MSDSFQQWTLLARRRLKLFIKEAQKSPTLRKLGGKSPWGVEVQVISAPVMQHLNSRYRGMKYATDVLSFPAPSVFKREKGELGEIVVCLPVLQRQAHERKTPEGRELDVLLVHGLLHLLGMDHEKSRKEAQRMARWEKKLLQGTGLINR